MKRSPLATNSQNSLRLLGVLTAALALTLGLVGCADQEQVAGAAETAEPASPCVVIDEPFYPTSQDLELAASVIAPGIITALELDPADETVWIVTVTTEHAMGTTSEYAVPEFTVRIPRLCGDAPFGDTFAVGGEFVWLLSGPRDGVFFLVNTAQGLIPVIDGVAVPLPAAQGVSISPTVAHLMGAPFAMPDDAADDGEFQAGNVNFGWPEGGVVPQFGWATLGAAWSWEPGVLWVLHAGSSSCPLQVSATANVNQSGGLVIPTRPGGLDEDGTPMACTDDLSPAMTRVYVPTGTDETQPLLVKIGDDVVTVMPRTVAGLPGPAAWVEPWTPPGAEPRRNDANTMIALPGSFVSGLPDGVTPPADLGVPGAAWSWVDGSIWVFTWGSSTCPAIPQREAAWDGEAFVIEFLPVDMNRPCTRDLVPLTAAVALTFPTPPCAADEPCTEITWDVARDGSTAVPLRIGDGPIITLPPADSSFGAHPLGGQPIWFPAG